VFKIYQALFEEVDDLGSGVFS